MQFTSLLAIVAFAGAVLASTDSNGVCSTGSAQCCATTHNGDEAKKTAALLGLNDVAGIIGISCQQVPINIIGVAADVTNYCKQTPVCCDKSEHNGLVQTGCTPISVN